MLSVVVLICGAIAITALELGAPLGSPLVKLCVAIALPLLVLTTADAAGAHLALGVGVDAGRSHEGAVPSRVGHGQRRRPGRTRRRRMHRPARLMDEFERGPDGRSTDLPSGGGVPPWLATSLNFCSRCGASLRFGLVAGEDRHRLSCDACGHIAYVNPRLVVTTFPVTEAGELILIKRGIEPGLGEWAQPGGFLEVDETVHQAAIRETWEETGLLVEPGDDHRALHTAGGGRRHDRLRGAHRRGDCGAYARGDRDPRLCARGASPGPTSPSAPRRGRCATGSTAGDPISAGPRGSSGASPAARRGRHPAGGAEL